MKNFKSASQWIVLVGGTIALFAGLHDAGRDAVPIAGAILIGAALNAFAIRRR